MKKIICLLLTITIVTAFCPVIEFTAEEEPTETLSEIWGDINLNGEVDDIDGMLLSRHLANWELDGTYDFSAIDLQDNGQVTDLDDLELTRYLAMWGIETKIGTIIYETKLQGVNIEKYVIVIPSEENIIAKEAAEYINLNINKLRDINLEIISDDQPEQTHEIIIGKTTRTVYQEFDKTSVGNFEFALYEQDGKVLVYGFDFLVAGGAYYFINNLVSERNRVHINIPEEGIYESPTPEQANNFILFIGDGMGQNHIKLLEAINPRIVNKTYDYFTARHFPNQGLSMTYAANNPVTDSAAGGTALATGYKTNKYFVGLDPNKNVIMNLCELAQSKDMKTAVLTTDSLQGATPAAFSSHVEHRDMAEEIRAQQLTSGIDYIIGDITEDTYVSTLKSAFETINVGENGFFMMYEEAHIDKESHNRNLVSTYEKMVRANNEINYIMSFIMYHPDTLLIITADHETGGLTYDELSKNIYFTLGDHTGADVPVYAYGIGTEIFNNKTVNNIEIAKFIATQMGEENFGQQEEAE